MLRILSLVEFQKTSHASLRGIVKRFGIRDFLSADDCQWFHYHQCQTYWLIEFPGLHTRSAPRPFYALYQISPDYTVLEFQIGANSEATYKAKQRGVTPTEPRVVRIRLTDGNTLAGDTVEGDVQKRPVRPFTGRLADKTFRQDQYEPSLDPVRTAGRFTQTARP